MAEQVKFDYSLTAGVISEDEMKAMEKITKDAKDVLVGKSGAVMSIIVLCFAWTKQKLVRWEGFTMLVMYAAYVVYICLR